MRLFSSHAFTGDSILCRVSVCDKRPGSSGIHNVNLPSRIISIVSPMMMGVHRQPVVHECEQDGLIAGPVTVGLSHLVVASSVRTLTRRGMVSVLGSINWG